MLGTLSLTFRDDQWEQSYRLSHAKSCQRPVQRLAIVGLVAMLAHIPFDAGLLGREVTGLLWVRLVTSALLSAIALGLVLYPSLVRRAHGLGTVAVTVYSAACLVFVWAGGPSIFEPYQTSYLLTVVVGFWGLRVRWTSALPLVVVLTLIDLAIVFSLEVAMAHRITAGISSLIAAVAASCAGYSWEQHERRHFLDRMVISEEQGLLQDMNKALREAVTRDWLTGLLNRRSLDQKLAELAALSRRYGTNASLIVMDLDRFKEVNDTHGHGAGDRVLQTFAMVVIESIRETDLAFRLGGDEFCVLLPGTRADAAVGLAERILKDFSTALDGEFPRVGMSAGCVEARPDEENAEDFLRRGDRQLYRAKLDGRGRVCCEVSRLEDRPPVSPSMVFGESSREAMEVTPD